MNGPCAICGKNPSAGSAHAYVNGVVYDLCHGDDDPTPTCYMRWTYGWRPEALFEALNKAGR